MKTMNAPTKKLFQIVCIVFILSALALSAHDVFTDTGSAQARSVTFAAALLSALLYCLYGFRKNDARYFRLFLCLYALAELVALAYAASGTRPLGAALTGVAFGCLCVLAEAKDLGRKRSMAFSIAVMAMTAAIGIEASVSLGSAGFDMNSRFAVIADVLLAAVLHLMLLAKYEDKAERGRKV